MLQELLNMGLVDIGPDDTRFDKLKAARDSLVKAMTEDPSILVPSTLIALDADASEDEPVFCTAERFVIDNWKTFRNANTERPRQLLRAIILDALKTAAEENPDIAGVIWHTAISPYNHGQVRLGREAKLVERWLCCLGEIAEQEAITRALRVGGLEQSGSEKSREKRTLKISYSEVTHEELLEDVERAAGPQSSRGVALPNANNQWATGGAQWAFQFSPRMAEALAKGVNAGMKRLSGSLTKALEQYLTALEQPLDELRAMVADTWHASDMRLEVLWWLEAKYSSSLKMGYRKLSPVVASLAMAHDLSRLVPGLVPASVIHILAEAAASLEGGRLPTQRLMLKDLLTELTKRGSKVRELFPPNGIGQGRVALLDLVVEAVNGNEIAAEHIRERTGVDSSLSIAVDEFAMWVFRDLQVRKIVESLQ